MNRSSCRALAAAVVACGLLAARAEALVAVPERSTLAEKVLRNPNLHIPTQLTAADKLGDDLTVRVAPDLAALGVGADSAFYDARAGKLTSFMLHQPLLPGDGFGNALSWGAAGRPADDAAWQDAAWRAVRAFLQDHQAAIKVDVAELGAPRVGVFEDGNIVQVYAERVLNGIPVRDSSVTAILNHGNLVLLGLQNWADGDRAEAAAIPETQAQFKIALHVAPIDVEGFQKGRLEYVPMVKGDGYEFRLVWAVRVDVVGDQGSWEGLVDAVNGDLIAFEDRNLYSRRVLGGVFPVSNDGRPPDGVEQAGWPMSFMTVVNGGSPATTTTGGNVACVAGSLTSSPAGALAGPFIRMADNCGAFNETIAAGDLDFGVSTGTDCTVPAGHSVGDTHSSRSGFYELNRIKEQARGYLPANAWLQAQLTSNMNIAQTCNAFWNGATVNFYRDSGSQCRNTGEIAAVFDHEWGHGMDNNGVNPNISSPGEAIADIHGNMRLMNSCMGRGFFKSQTCSGYGDGCIGTTATGCTGVRDLDFAQHRCNRPHTITWAQSGFTSAQCGGGAAAPACPISGGTPCGRETHCEGMISAEVGWDIFARDLQAAPFNFDSNTALELATRLAFLGSQSLTSWYTCSIGGGCGATNGYMLWLAADDDNGNLNDGTPHMQAIRGAFERHEIHCATPAVVNSGCAGGPTTAPTVTATATVEGVDLSWAPVTGASNYAVYRTEGVFACNFGKVKIATVAGTTFSDTGLQGGRQYSYVVLPIGANTSCFGRASTCASAVATPSACAPTADFTISCAPSTLTANQGGNATSTCTIQSQVGFSSPVNLSCTGQPANVTCGFSPASVTPPANGSVTSTLTVTVGPTVPAGSYNFSAQGVSGALVHSFAMSLNVNAISLAPAALSVDAGGNGVLQPNETVAMAPSWRNNGATAVTATGATSNFTGPLGPTYTNPDATGAYGSIAANGTNPCTDCYTLNVASTTRPLTHWDGTIVETITPGAATKTWTLHIGDSFTDVPAASPFYRFIETILHKNVTGGCTTSAYCPVASTTREQMAVFVLVSKEGPGYTPPACVAPNLFSDVPDTSPFCRFIEELANRGVVTGCGPNLYCPTAPATREQMAVFVLRTLDPAMNPPACTTPVFSDVPASSPFCKWIEELVRRGVVTGCGGNAYCPTADVSREQMSVFLTVTFSLVLYGL